jgi:predicted HTH transcriptional regulator
MEREGYGIPMMPTRLKEYGLRPPDFEYDGGYFSVIFYGREKSSPALRIQSGIREQLTSRQIEIISVAWERKKVTSKEIRDKFKITRETANQDFTKLLELGLVVRKGTGRATYYVLGPLLSNGISFS